MNETTTILLENEMDLILANKQSMRLAELTGLKVSSQTLFATAVAEISRIALERSSKTSLKLYTSQSRSSHKFLKAIIHDIPIKNSTEIKEGLNYAKKLVSKLTTVDTPNGISIELTFNLPSATPRLDDDLIERISANLNADPEVSPYEEIKRKNRQLVELSELLSKSESEYQSLTDSLQILIFTINREGRVMYGNNWTTSYTGKSIEVLNETNWGDTIQENEQEDIRAVFRENIDSAKDITLQYRLREAQTGIYKWHSGIATPTLDDDGNLVHWHAFMTDIHAQKMIEETLKDNQKLKETQQILEEKIQELNNSNQQLEQFAFIASHDLQEPLRKISMYSDMIQNHYRGELSERGNAMFDKVVVSTERMRQLIRDVLNYSQLKEHNDLLATVNLNEILEQAKEEMEMSLQDKNSIVEVDELPSIIGNPRQLKQLFENLISNSIKYMEEGKQPIIKISSTEEENAVKVVVSDNGIGFDPIYIDKMFDLFQRLHARGNYSGTGIGLSICKRIMQAHGGSITAESTPGEGSRFILTFPK